MSERFSVIVIGGGHAGVEAAWAAANVLRQPRAVALVTLNPDTIGVMSCNPAIGGLAKGQLVREIDALNGLMGLATDATGIQFRMLNTSKGAAVRGPRAQCDKHAYASEVRRLIAERPEIVVIPGTVERLLFDGDRIVGLACVRPGSDAPDRTLLADAVVLTTGTFMRGLMHTGPQQTPGGRFGEAPAIGISAELQRLGLELGRLKTGTPPRLDRASLDWHALPEQLGDSTPEPFSDLSALKDDALSAGFSIAGPFPALPQVSCRETSTNAGVHDLIRANLDRAPLYSGQITSAGPRYCPSIEDKVVRFADRTSHGVYLEPESLSPDALGTHWIYCNGISTSLPGDVQERIVRGMPGCQHARILRYGYAVEYDMVRPHQIAATCQTKRYRGLFLAGQINGTSGYEEAAGQGLVAGLNAARLTLGMDVITVARHEAYIGVLLDDLATKTPVEPYRMFTSRAEHRLLLRADNAVDRLAPRAAEWGLFGGLNPRGELLDERTTLRLRINERRQSQIAMLERCIEAARISDGGQKLPLAEVLRRPETTTEAMIAVLEPMIDGRSLARGVAFTAHTNAFYARYIERAKAEVRRLRDVEHRPIPAMLPDELLAHLRGEARAAFRKFAPATLGQAGRLEGFSPADVGLLRVLIEKHTRAQRSERA
jgi:tRNA uridine 5-carboxymethylaminomethyl modification enzyme